MKFKKLIMTGFKSFADRTEFVFGPGMTGLVGPNGCGKSNVVDAIKWVLGEQRPTSLRSKEMSDVIFNGNATRKSMGFCEVSLICDNADRLLPIESDEVVVIRRVYRDGKSEYLINKKPSLLRNVKELFMGTGIGMDNYSVIEQGKLERLLSSNPVERRMIFEEAAGISKYRLRRKETERKLDRTEQNLVRLRDILEELEKRVNSVRRQAAKARRYREIQGELEHKQSTLALRDYKVFSEDLDKVESDLATMSQAQTQVVTVSDTLEAELARADERLLELEQELAAKGRAQFDQDQIVTQCEERIKSNRETITLIDTDQQDSRSRIAQLEDRLQELQDDIGSQEQRLQSVDQKVETAEIALATSLETMGKRDEEHRANLHAIEMKRDEMFNVERERSELRNSLDRSHQARDAAEAGRQRILGRLQEQRNTETELVQAETQAEIESESVERDVDAMAEDMKALDQRREAVDAEFETLSTNVDEHKQSLASIRSRLDVLQDFKTRLEGVGGGVKTVLAEENQTQYQGLQGLLADAFQVDRHLAAALQAALGERATAVVATGKTTVIDHVRSLRKDQIGRVMFISHEWLPETLPTKVVLTGDGVIGNAFDLIRPEQEHAAVLEWLLGQVVVVQDLDTVLSLLPTHPGITFVTLDGDLVHKDGFVSGGESEGAELVVQRVELLDTENALTEQRQACTDAETHLQILSGERESLAIDSKRTRQAIYELNITLLERKNVLESVLKELQALRDEIKANSFDLEQCTQSFEQASASGLAFQQHLQRLESAASVSSDNLEEMKSQVENRERALQEARELVTSRKVEITQAVSSRDAVHTALAHQRTEEEDKRISLSSLQQRMTENEERRVRLLAEIGEREISIADSMHLKADLETVLLHLRKEREELRESVSEKRNQVKELQGQGHQLEEQLSSLRVQENQLGMQIENLKLRMMDEYQIDLTEAIRAFRPEDVEGIDWDELREEVAVFRKKLKALGNVNLDALDELEELETRHEFMNTQEQDLSQAKESMLEVIARIDETCKELFSKTFDQVKENFKVLFRRCFGGGKGDLILIDPEQVLETGIDIIARPPGKLPKSLNLLSGGEKAMTTVALMFAIFQIRPAPFCILDEVDAPLDESNIDRFVSMVRSFLDVSQFLIITHSKRTMSSADVLYGVTQQESGVSKKIVVQFEEEAAAV